jgi:hypothetical protein
VTRPRRNAEYRPAATSGVSLATALRIPHMQNNVGALPRAANQTPQKRTRDMTRMSLVRRGLRVTGRDVRHHSICWSRTTCSSRDAKLIGCAFELGLEHPTKEVPVPTSLYSQQRPTSPLETNLLFVRLSVAITPSTRLDRVV